MELLSPENYNEETAEKLQPILRIHEDGLKAKPL